MFVEKLHKTIILVGIGIVVLAVVIGFSLNQVLAQEHDTTQAAIESVEENHGEETKSKDANTVMAAFIAIAGTVSISCLGAAYAVGKVGAAAMGAASERPELMGRALIFVGLAEGIAIYGLIIAIMLLGKI